MDKFLLILFFITKILAIIVVPIIIFVLKKKNKYLYIVEIAVLLLLVILYLCGVSFVVDSNIGGILNLKLISESTSDNSFDYYNNIRGLSNITSIDADISYKTHRNDDVYYFNGYELPLAAKRVDCGTDYDYYKYYSDIMTSTAMLLSTYFNQNITPIEIYNKTVANNLISCGNPINKDSFFYMISNEYNIYFNVIGEEELRNYVLNGKPVLLETSGNGYLSCNESYFLIYSINNSNEYLMLDPNNRSYRHICPEGSTGFGNVLEANYNELTFDYLTITMDANRFIVIGGTR
ncbi:MAG: hypothetical protein IKH36_01440 [Bacilli bacterium]|nr:hypothetical protein [Bacilli bacterium]